MTLRGKRTRIAAGAALAGLMAIAALPAAAGQATRVDVTDAHVLVSPMHEGGGVFMSLTNSGTREAVITHAEAPVADTVSLHRCSGRASAQMGQGGQARRLEPATGPLVIPAGGRVDLQRGGRHLCMTGTNEKFKLGAEFPLTLTFTDGSTKTVPLKVDGVAKPRRGRIQGQGGQQ